MAALTGDIKIIQYGDPGFYQRVTQPIGANVQLYRGTIALTNGPNSSVAPGYLKRATVPTSTDVCWGLLEAYGPGTADTIPGMLGATTNGGTTANIRQGTFFLKSGTGSDQLSQSTIGQTVYVIDEQTVGASSSGGTRPVAGVHEAVDPTAATTLFAISLGSNQTSGGL